MIDINNITKQENILDNKIDSIIKGNNANNDAYIYLYKNIEKIKFIVSGYHVDKQYDAVIEHLKLKFNITDNKNIKILLKKNGIYSAIRLYITVIFILSIIIGLFLYGLNMTNIIPEQVGNGPLFLMIFSISFYMVFYIIQTYKIRFYRLSPEYKNIKVPADSIL